MLGLNIDMVEDLQLENRGGNLEHEDMRMAVVVHDQDAFYDSSYSKVFLVVLEASLVLNRGSSDQISRFHKYSRT